ncbi:MAG TPA: tetratricopeptide repeat protein [Bryobacteraceae bacterium]|nr:tetratricopeptide repeat protein [Bryobacteraceae bacterium]
MTRLLIFAIPVLALANGVTELETARDRQDQQALDKLVSQYRAAADKQPKDATSQYQLALAESYAAEVAVEIRDKAKANGYAETGITAAEKAVGMKPDVAEYHRILGTLCGQMISSMGLAGIKYGKCAMTSVNKAIELDPKSSSAYLSHGVGNYYLPSALGGGVDLAIKDFEKAIELNPKSAEAYCWLGVALRKANRPAEARKAFSKSLELNPNRLWAKQQLDKTPADKPPADKPSSAQ